MNTKFIRFAACAAAWGALAFGASGADGDKPQSQQGRFASCAHASKGLKGDAHQDFMSECLKGHEEEAQELKREAPQRASAEGSFQQAKMKTCNDEAGRKNLHGDERRAFMSTCLKG